MLEKNTFYAYENEELVSRFKTGFFLGCIVRPIPSQSFNDERKQGLYWVFGTKPSKLLIGKKNDFVLDENLKNVFKLEKVENWRNK